MIGDDQDAYDAWIAKVSKGCLNCPSCGESPCGGCMQGGVCDQARCRCDDDPEGDDFNAEDSDFDRD